MTIVPGAVYITPRKRLVRALDPPTAGPRSHEDGHAFVYLARHGRQTQEGFYLTAANLKLLRPAPLSIPVFTEGMA